MSTRFAVDASFVKDQNLPTNLTPSIAYVARGGARYESTTNRCLPQYRHDFGRAGFIGSRATQPFFTGAGTPPPARTNADVSLRRYLAGAWHGRRRCGIGGLAAP